jgi:hypothetical protein
MSGLTDGGFVFGEWGDGLRKHPKSLLAFVFIHVHSWLN